MRKAGWQKTGFWYIGLVGILLAGCGPERSEVEKITSVDTYYDVQGLLAESESQLREMNVVLHKKATFSGAMEEETISLDSAGLAEELDIFREVDINKPVLSDRYLTENKEINGQEVITYRADDKEALNINYLKVYKNISGNEVERLEALFSSRNILYNSTRLLILQYGDVNGQHLPIYYQVEGSQKMIFNDNEEYIIKANFDYTAAD